MLGSDNYELTTSFSHSVQAFNRQELVQYWLLGNIIIISSSGSLQSKKYFCSY